MNETAAGGVGVGLIVAFAVILMVNRSNSPARYAQEEARTFRRDSGDSFVSDEDTRVQGGGAVGAVIFGLGFVLRFMITSPATVVGINLHPVGNVLMVIGGLSIIASILITVHSRRVN